MHAVEVDAHLEALLGERLAGRRTSSSSSATRSTCSHGLRAPAPTKLVANLPYNVATPIVMESLAALPTVQLWCVMVQREVADRFFAAPGTKDYGAVSVVLQLSTERSGFHPVARTCFRPPPNVDSALVAFRRRRTGTPTWLRFGGWRRRRFAHRRKTLANSLELAGLAERGSERRRARRAWPRADVRAEALAPGVPPPLRAARMRPARAVAAAKINLALVVGPRRDDGLHEVATVLQRIDVCDRLELQPAAQLAVEGFADDTIVGQALTRLAAEAGVEPAWSVRISKEIPVAAGLGGGSADAAAALQLANERLQSRSLRTASHALAASLGADVPSSSSRGRSWPRARGSVSSILPQDFWVAVAVPREVEKSSTREVYEGFDALGGGPGFEERRPICCADSREASRPADLAALPANDLARRRPAQRSLAADLLRGGRVSGRRERRRTVRLRPLPEPRGGAFGGAAAGQAGPAWIAAAVW